MIIQENESLFEQLRSVGARHRERGRALMSSHEIGALGRLETALELSQAAQEVV